MGQKKRNIGIFISDVTFRTSIIQYREVTVPDRSNLTGNALPERLGNAKRNGKGTLRERKKERKGNA